MFPLLLKNRKTIIAITEGSDFSAQVFDLYVTWNHDLVICFGIEQGRHPTIDIPQGVVLAGEGAQNNRSPSAFFAFQHTEHLAPGFTPKIIKGTPWVGMGWGALKIDAFAIAQLLHQKLCMVAGIAFNQTVLNIALAAPTKGGVGCTLFGVFFIQRQGPIILHC